MLSSLMMVDLRSRVRQLIFDLPTKHSIELRISLVKVPGFSRFNLMLNSIHTLRELQVERPFHFSIYFLDATQMTGQSSSYY